MPEHDVVQAAAKERRQEREHFLRELGAKMDETIIATLHPDDRESLDSTVEYVRRCAVFDFVKRLTILMLDEKYDPTPEVWEYVNRRNAAARQFLLETLKPEIEKFARTNTERRGLIFYFFEQEIVPRMVQEAEKALKRQDEEEPEISFQLTA